MKHNKLPASNILSRLTTQKTHLTNQCREMFNELRQSIIDNCDLGTAEQIYVRLRDISKMRHMLSEISEDLQPQEAEQPHFLMSSELLYEAFRTLCKIPTESILYGVGNRYGNTFSMERLVQLQLDESQYGYARANVSHLSKTLIELEEYGSLLTCFLHAHPGRGPQNNHPSPTDIDNQARLESGMYNAIGAIFSRDGYVRFFSDKLKYKLSISGKGVEYVSKDVYRLTQVH